MTTENAVQCRAMERYTPIKSVPPRQCQRYAEGESGTCRLHAGEANREAQVVRAATAIKVVLSPVASSASRPTYRDERGHNYAAIFEGGLLVRLMRQRNRNAAWSLDVQGDAYRNAICVWEAV